MLSGVATRVKKSPAKKQKPGLAKAIPGSWASSLAVLFKRPQAVQIGAVLQYIAPCLSARRA
jgi:hypothetical protein